MDDDHLDDIFNNTPKPPAKISDDPIADDSEFARQGIRELIAEGREALTQLQEIAMNSGMPLAYENYKELFSKLIDAHVNLMDVQKTKTDIDVKRGLLDKSPSTINNNLILNGTTRDFMRVVDKLVSERDAVTIDSKDG